MPSIHLSAVVLVILATSPLVGCSHSLDAGWPPGTEVILSNPARVAAVLPGNQQAKIWNDCVVLESQTSVVIMEDPVFPRRQKARSGLTR